MGKTLYECSKQQHDGFFSVLKWLDQRSFKSAKVIPLIKIDYFQQFGNNNELLRLTGIFDYFNQGTSKTVKKDKLDPVMTSFVSRFATDKGVKGNELKSYTITDMDGLLSALEEYIFELDLPELPYRVRAENQRDILGYVDLTTDQEADRRKLYILDKFAIQNRWNAKGGVFKYRLKTKSIGSGKTSSLSVSPALMDKKPFNVGDIIFAKKVLKDQKGYWNLVEYEVMIE